MKVPERAIERRIRKGLEELLMRPLDKESDTRRLPRSTPGMRDFLRKKGEPLDTFLHGNELKHGTLERKITKYWNDPNPVRRA